MLFQRIAGTNQTPDLIQTEPFQRLAGDMRMPLVRRIERPSEQTDHLTGSGIWKPLTHA